MIFAIGSLIGASLLNLFSTLPQISVVALNIVLAATLALCLERWATRQWPKRIGWGLLSCALGLGWAAWVAHKQFAAGRVFLDHAQAVTLKGHVHGIVHSQDSQCQFDFVCTELEGRCLAQNPAPRVRLFWKAPTILLKHHDALTLKVRLKIPYGLSNPQTFDREKQNFQAGIGATGRVMHCLQHQPASAISLHALRQQLLTRLKSRWPDEPLMAIVAATTVGFYGDMQSTQFEVFAKTGTLHAVAISGSHIALVAWMMAFCATAAARQSCRLTCWMPASHYGVWAGLIGAITYAALAGFALPTQRAMIMIAVASAALLRGRRLWRWEPLAWAWIGVWAADPLATLDKGFWLSFACVAVLISLYQYKTLTRWQKWLLPQVVLFVALIPLNLFFFDQIVWGSVFANLLSLPLLGFWVVPLSLLGVFLLPLSLTLSDLCLQLALWGLKISWCFLAWVSTIPYVVMHCQVPVRLLVLGTASVLIVLWAKKYRLWGAIGCLLCLGFVCVPKHLPSGTCKITVLDVGQGLSVFVRTARHSLLFDTGPSYGQHANAGSRVVLPFLEAQPIRVLDALIISHSDLDHSGGWPVLRQFPCKRYYSSEPTWMHPEALACIPEKSWVWDGVHFRLFAATGMPRATKNNQSCVLKVSTAHHSVLITGDIEALAEKALIAKAGSMLQSNVLLVPHHGSRSSSTKDFIKAVSPQYALYSVGFHNAYGFPDPAVMQRYADQGAKNLLTYEKGAIEFQFGDNKELTPPTCWRDTHRRYWHRRAN